MRICECGCGTPTKGRYYSDHSKYGAKYCACNCGALLSSHRYTYKLGCAQKGERNPYWKGGRIIPNKKKPYIYILNPDHPSAIKGGYIAEHRLVMEQSIGRMLTADESVHHLNKDVQDNRIENLKVVKHGQHTRLERSYSRVYLLQCLKAFHEKHGRRPKSSEANPSNGIPYLTTYLKYFYSWKNALLQAGLPNSAWDRRRSIEQGCLVCGKTFYPRTKNQKHCSRECYHPIIHETNCPVCNKIFKPERVTPEERRQIYCSKACSNRGRSLYSKRKP